MDGYGCIRLSAVTKKRVGGRVERRGREILPLSENRGTMHITFMQNNMTSDGVSPQDDDTRQ